jgi:DNA-binding MarR family transcriptional regulator
MAKLDTIIHQPARLKIMSALMSIDMEERVDFTYLKKLLELTDGNLGAHLNKLEEADYINIKKVFVGKKPKTYICLSGKGRDALMEHIAALQEIVKGIKG